MDIIEQIEKWGNKNAIYKPFENAVCYPLHSRDFIQRGFCEICPTLCARDYKDPKCVIERSKMEEQMIVAMRGRNPDNPSDRTKGIETEQRLEPQQEGITILSGYHRTNMTGFNADNGVMEKVKIKQATEKGYAECDIGGVADLSYPDSKTRRGRVQESGQVSPTLTSCGMDGIVRIESQYKIRKLTPRECYRLMGFTDEEFDKAEKVNSSTQLYKQAGNSIVVDVLVEIFKELILSLEGKSPRYKEDEQMSLFDFM